jgi:predicted transposase YbfD/YdcC
MIRAFFRNSNKQMIWICATNAVNATTRAVILIQVMMALLSNRDGNLSSIHRHLSNHHEKLREALNLPPSRAVSRAQLPVILSKVSVEVLNQLIFESYGIELNEAERKWFAADGKELRGSINSGDKRGEVVVAGVGHESGQIQANNYYNGTKESEIPTLRKLLTSSGLCGQKISLDALHCNPETLKVMHRNGGAYLVGLKDNQVEMLSECLLAVNSLKSRWRSEQVEKGHGRIERRETKVFDIREIYADERWMGCGIATLLAVERERTQTTTNRRTTETSYYLSNQTTDFPELCAAVRHHWRVETTNWLRDCTFREDGFRTKKNVLHEQCRSCEG